jgi:hypothetical protein
VRGDEEEAEKKNTGDVDKMDGQAHKDKGIIAPKICITF